MDDGFLPLGRTGVDGFTARLLACLRLDCLGDSETSVPKEAKSAGLALLAAGAGATDAASTLITRDGGSSTATTAAAVELCATRKALAQLSEGLGYYNDGPAVAHGTAQPWPSLVEEGEALAWLAAEAAGTGTGPTAGQSGPFAVLQGHVSAADSDHTSSSGATGTGVGDAGNAAALQWGRAGRALRAQRQREWLLVSLRRWEHTAYQSAYTEAATAAAQAAAQVGKAETEVPS